MNKYFLSLLFSVALLAPSFGAEPKTDAAVEVPAVVDVQVGKEVRRFRLIPQDDAEPRTEEYKPETAPALDSQAPPVERPRLERLGNIGDVVVPLLAALLGATAGPQIGGLINTIWGALRGKKAIIPGSTDPLGNTNAVEGVVKIAEVLKRLAPVFAAIEQLSKQVPKSENTSEVPTTTPSK